MHIYYHSINLFYFGKVKTFRNYLSQILLDADNTGIVVIFNLTFELISKRNKFLKK